MSIKEIEVQLAEFSKLKLTFAEMLRLLEVALQLEIVKLLKDKK